jgi:transcription antitermination factor NusG
MLQLNENPPGVFPGETLTMMGVGTWWVAHTKSRFEKAFAWDLARRGVSYFLPMVERSFVSGGRKRTGMYPLFPSYVFCCGSREDRVSAMMTNRICQIIEVKDQARLLEELTQIEKALRFGEGIELIPSMPVGARCRVTAGALEGLEGVVMEHLPRMRLALNVSILGQSVGVEIDRENLEHIQN